MLEDHSVTHRQLITVEEVWVHPLNRSGLGLNPAEAHKVLATVKSIGGDFDHLRKACCFELATSGPAHDDQRKFNLDLIERSNGLMAAQSGKERLMSVSCSHFCAALRAAKSRCRTDEQSIADNRGFLNELQLSKGDPALQKMMQSGWSWLVIPAAVEAQWPQLPHLAQEALNSVHSTYTVVSELQAMSALAVQISTKGADWKAAVAAVAASEPPCKQYLTVLSDFVRMYGGGPDAPVIKYPALVPACRQRKSQAQPNAN